MDNKTQIKPYLTIPYLYEKPTWGGSYISQFKAWHHKEELQDKKIGQSYELYGKTKLALRMKHSGSKEHSFESRFTNLNEDYVELSDLIQSDPFSVLGSKVFLKHGKMPLLLKLTQAATGNSYQLHAQKQTDKWEKKPESFYYLEPGLMTFGVKENVDFKHYQKVCQKIEEFMKDISNQIQNSFIRLDEAREKSQQFINEEHPIQFVNFHEVKKGEIIDLADGGIHHSWEEDLEKYPLGSIVYEINFDKTDAKSTIRSFDQGKFKDDGSVRNIHIDDYFQHLDRNPENNSLEIAQDKPITLQENQSGLVKKIVFNEHYGMEEIEILTSISNEYTTTTDSFHHLFVREGEVEITCKKEILTVTRGHSAFIPASTGKYELKNKETKAAIVIKSYC